MLGSSSSSSPTRQKTGQCQQAAQQVLYLRMQLQAMKPPAAAQMRQRTAPYQQS
jgi:hypothetical protein